MRRVRGVLAVAAAVAFLAAGCSDDEGTAHGQGEGGTGSSEAAPPAESTEGSGSDTTPVDPYDGHTSEVYDADEHWICRPDLADDECRDLDVTVFEADGSTTVEDRAPAADPPIDCFYVYPTVSADPAPLADLEWTPEDAEATTVVAQAAQYARSCRVFAPVYRQIPLAGLGQASSEERATAYADVVDAWKTYVSRWNEGRGVILIGHSQGTGHLARLIDEEVDGVPDVQDLLVSAHLFGGSIHGFEGVPACTSADETGCVVTYSSYPADAPPAADAIFGATEDGERALCVDPTDLLGAERARPVAPIGTGLMGTGIEGVETPFAALPGALEVSCEATADHDYLAVGVADAGDPRPLDGMVTELLGPTWGLHLVDMTVALDDLVALAGRQGEAYVDR